MAKTKQVDYGRGDEFEIYCPGCKSHHSLTVEKQNNCGARWGFNWNLEKPTFTPSLKVTWDQHGRKEGAPLDSYDEKDYEIKKHHCCHSFITDGIIDFLGDCTHELRGKFQLPDIE